VVQVAEGRAILTTLTVQENLDLGAYTRKDKAQISKDLDYDFICFRCGKTALLDSQVTYPVAKTNAGNWPRPHGKTQSAAFRRTMDGSGRLISGYRRVWPSQPDRADDFAGGTKRQASTENLPNAVTFLKMAKFIARSGQIAD
jgi:hypothetical protein